jgi:hypothetical protein
LLVSGIIGVIVGAGGLLFPRNHPA